ncbi:MAG: ribonuclease P protein component [Muribaculum sp.]|nr:ribonuclease P protein component [Muribaculum sp.]
MTEDVAAEISVEDRFTLRKSAKLRHRTLVQDLFKKGRTVYSGPLRVTFRPLSETELADSFRENVPDRIGPVQMMITVPKKKRRHAVDRVLMRRRIREAFRTSYHPLRQFIQQNPGIRTLSLAIIYLQPENCGMPAISAAVNSVLLKIVKKLDPEISETTVQESNRDVQALVSKTECLKPLL